MADSQATNVIDAGNLIKGLMTNNESTPVESAPTEVSEEPTETVTTEEEGLLTEETESPNEIESYEAEETSRS